MVVMSHLSKGGKSRFGRLSDSDALSNVGTWVSTQCTPLDAILGGKGLPVGRMVEIFGDTSTGKTLLALHVLAETQAMGGTAVLLDVESTVDLGVAEIVGVDIDTLVYNTPEVIEEVFDDIQAVLEAKQEVDPDGIMTIVWDSIAATSSDAEVAKVLKEGLSTGYPPTAKEISQMMRVMKTIVARNRILLLMLNQTRVNIGVMFGEDIDTFGGKAVSFYSSVRLLLKQGAKIKDKGTGVVRGVMATAYVHKSKVCAPFGRVSMPIMFDVGIDDPGAVLDWLKSLKVVKTRGGWYSIKFEDGDELKFQAASWAEVYRENREDILYLAEAAAEQ